jgi:hypothetical protein
MEWSGIGTNLEKKNIKEIYIDLFKKEKLCKRALFIFQ